MLWRRQTGALQPLLGAGDDGTVTVVTFQRPAGEGSLLLAIGRDGRGGPANRDIAPRRLGVPAVLGRTAFVPWEGQYVSAIDLGTGDEVGRVTLRQQTSRAWTQAGFLSGSGRSVSSASTSTSGGSALQREGVHGRREAPRTPWNAEADVGRHIAGLATGQRRGQGARLRPPRGDRRRCGAIRRPLVCHLLPSRHVGFAGADRGALAWVHLHSADFVGGQAASGGMVLCDDQGKITELDATTGGVLAEADLGEPVKGCVVNVEGWRGGNAPKDVKPLAAQLAEAVLADDPQLAIAQKLLLRELGGIADQTATKTLVDLASDPRTSPDLVADARTSLAKRRNGASYMIAALQRHYDFLKDVLRAPPVGPMAQALGAMKEKAAAPFLASHLLDPADTDDDVKQSAIALAVVAGPAELSSLHQFFGMYRASAENDELAAAVVGVGQALLTVNDAAERPLVEAASKDPTTVACARAAGRSACIAAGWGTEEETVRAVR